MPNYKYIWLKLNRDFFKNHKIRFVESLPNGDKIMYFYIKLLTESIDHEGYLRYSEKKPYTAEMLSVVLSTSIDIVNESLKILLELELIEKLDDGTIHILDMKKFLGEATSTERVKRYRDKLKNAKKEEQEENEDDEESTVIIQPKIEELFNLFWKAYPRKIGKDKCLRWFKIHKVNNQDFVNDLITAINMQKGSIDWKKKDGEYIPHPLTWLNRGGWNDELRYDKPIEEKIKNRWEGFINARN